jgi:molybdopterin-guanine dinucleotide biosynthesis protein A
MRIAGAILAGGQASRYGGQPKGLLRLPSGETILERQLQVFKEAGIDNPIICAGDIQAYNEHGYATLADRLPGVGPLAGIEAALAHFSPNAEAVQFLPCDMPLIAAAVLLRLQAEFRRRAGGIVFASTCTISCHSLCLIVHTELLPQIRLAIDNGMYTVHRLCKDLEAHAVQFAEEACFANINTPADLHALWPEENIRG